MQVNPDVIGSLEEHGLNFVGKDESGKRMEVGFCFIGKGIHICIFFVKNTNFF